MNKDDKYFLKLIPFIISGILLWIYAMWYSLDKHLGTWGYDANSIIMLIGILGILAIPMVLAFCYNQNKPYLSDLDPI